MYPPVGGETVPAPPLLELVGGLEDYSLLYTTIHYYILLYNTIYYYILLYTIIYYYILLYSIAFYNPIIISRVGGLEEAVVHGHPLHGLI